MGKLISVLLVDDESDYTQPMAFWLKSKGYDVFSVTNGQDAITFIKETPPDIVFLDINMPIMDGPTTLRKIREFNADIPIIIISAYIDDPRAKGITSYGISGVFYKGSDFNEGLTLIEAVLRTHKNLKNK